MNYIVNFITRYVNNIHTSIDVLVTVFGMATMGTVVVMILFAIIEEIKEIRNISRRK